MSDNGDNGGPEDFGTQLERYHRTAQRRDRVPSARELRNGTGRGDYVYRPTVVEPRPPRLSFRKQMSVSIKAMNPRGIADNPHSRYGLIMFGLLATVTQIDDIAIAVAIPFIRLDMGFDFQTLFTIVGLTEFARIGLTPLFGFLADRVKRVRMVQVGALLGNAASVFAALSPGAGSLSASRFFGGIGPSLQNSASGPLVADYFPIEKRTRAFGFIGAASLMGPPIMALLAVLMLLIIGINWRIVIGGTGLLATIVSLGTFKLREPVRGGVDRQTMGMSAEEAAKEPPPVSWSEAWRVSKSIHTLRILWYAAPLTTLGGAAMANLLYFVTVQRASRAPSGQWGMGILGQYPWLPMMFATAVPAFVGFFLTAWMTPVIEKMVKQRPGQVMTMFGASQLVVVLGIGFLVVNPLLILNLPIGALMSIPFALLAVGYNMVLSVIVPSRVRGQAMASIAPWQLIGIMLLPIVGGLADAYGAAAAAMAMMPVYIAGTVILMTGGTTVDRDIRAALAASLAEEEVRKARLAGSNKMIVARDVDVTYAGTQVLFNVDLDVGEGELIAVLGTNGAGKSTLLRAIAGIHEASNGAIFLDGEDITHKASHLNARQGVVFLPGGRAVFPSLSVAENLRLATWLRRKDDNADEGSAERMERVRALFPILEARASERAGDLSGGEQQMLALAQAFLMKPRLLMIDELSLGLAPSIVERLLDVLRDIHRQGTTVLLVEQSVNVALTVAERAVFMDKGRIMFDGPTTDLLGRPDLVRSVYLGGSGTRLARSVRSKPSAADANEPALVIDDAAVSFGGVHALDGVSLSVAPGEVVGIIGPNGAGKTTLFDIVTGLVRPDRGLVRIAGVDVTDLGVDERARLGLARSFQNTRLFPSLTVRENLAVALDRRVQARSPLFGAVWAPNVRKDERRMARRIDVLIETLGLGAFANKFVGELSTGSRRLVEVAAIMGVDPVVLLLDEPSSGLAQAETEVLGPSIQRIARETGAGVVVIEHDMPLLVDTASRLVAMELGRVVAVGSPVDVIRDPRVVSAYLGADESVIRRSGNPVLTGALNALNDLSRSPQSS